MQHTCTEVCQSPESRLLGHLPARMAWWPPGPQNFSKTPGFMKEFPWFIWGMKLSMMLLTLGYEVHVDRIEHSVVGQAAQLPKQICKVWKCPTRSPQVLYSIGIHWHGHCIFSSLWHLKILQSYSFCLLFFLFCTPHLCAFVFYFSDFFFDCPCPTSAHACSILPSYHAF